jgi:hypothetical protein
MGSTIPITAGARAGAWVERLGNPALRPPADAAPTPDGDGWLRRTLVFEAEYAETRCLASARPSRSSSRPSCASARAPAPRSQRSTPGIPAQQSD